VDTIMLGLMKPTAVVGYYNAAYRIFYIGCGVVSMWLMALLPVVSRRLTVSRERTELFLGKHLRLTMIAMVPVMVLAFLTAPLIVRLIFGGEYGQSVLALQILVWALVPFIISNTYGSLVLLPAGHFNQFFWAVMAGAFVNVALNLALIPAFSLFGAALATILAYLCAGLVAFYFSRRVVSLGLVRNSLVPVLVAGLSLLPFFAVYRTFPGEELLRLALSGSAFAVFYAAVVLLVERKFILDFAAEVLRRDTGLSGAQFNDEK
jgi:O-antigen/teichoic acid export membrane protein